MLTKPKLTTVAEIRNKLQNGLDYDTGLIEAYRKALEAVQGQDGKPLGKLFLRHVQKTIPNACYRHVAEMTYICFLMNGKQWEFLLSYTGSFDLSKLSPYNTSATKGAPERNEKRGLWLSNEAALSDIADKINAYIEAKWALEVWQEENSLKFPDHLKGLSDC